MLLEIAGKLDGGVLVIVVEDADLAAVRQECSGADNVMVVAADPDGSIPWRDEFFSKVFAPNIDKPEEELLRVLGPDGLMYLSTGVYPRPSAV